MTTTATTTKTGRMDTTAETNAATLAEPRRSETTARAVEFVAAHKPEAEALGRRLAESVGDPEGFAQALAAGFADLADPQYLEGTRRIAPGIGPVVGVRWPLTAAVERAFRDATRKSGSSGFLEVATRLFAEPRLEPRWFAFGLLDRILPNDAERAWQLLRRAAREAGDWITVDTLAHPMGRGIILEPYRWAELDGLVFSPSRWERRLVGSTVATLPFVDRRAGRTAEVVGHGLDLIGELIGDAEPDVQKALAWALRSLTIVDREAVLVFVDQQAHEAAAAGDGNRAWVLRDTLAKLPPDAAERFRSRLDGIRRRSSGPSTSRAAATAARFAGTAGLPSPAAHRERFPDLATRGDIRP